jgi:hypothetical protein
MLTTGGTGQPCVPAPRCRARAWRLAQQQDGGAITRDEARAEDHAGHAPAEARDQRLKERRHDRLAQRPAGGHDPHRHARLPVEPERDGRQQRRVETGEAQETDGQIDRWIASIRVCSDTSISPAR